MTSLSSNEFLNYETGYSSSYYQNAVLIVSLTLLYLMRANVYHLKDNRYALYLPVYLQLLSESVYCALLQTFVRCHLKGRFHVQSISGSCHV